jgi:hypothetical protein
MAGIRKRAPGGGRKPQGQYGGNTATITVRVRPEVRAELDRERKRNRLSLSQEIQKRLTASFDNLGRKQQPKTYGWTEEEIARNRALAALVGQLAARLERATGASWRRDRYTFDALVAAIGMMLDRMTPAGAVAVPQPIRETAERFGSAGDQLNDPAGAAAMVALSLLNQMMTAELPPADHPENVHYAEGYYLLPKIRQALNLNGDEK